MLKKALNISLALLLLLSFTNSTYAQYYRVRAYTISSINNGVLGGSSDSVTFSYSKGRSGIPKAITNVDQNYAAYHDFYYPLWSNERINPGPINYDYGVGHIPTSPFLNIPDSLQKKYDANNNLIEYCSSGTHQPEKYIYTYNNKNQLASISIQLSTGYNQWENNWKKVFIYNANGQLIKIDYHYWDKQNNIWDTEGWEIIYTYSGQDLVRLEKHTTVNNQINPASKEEFFYHNNIIDSSKFYMFANNIAYKLNEIKRYSYNQDTITKITYHPTGPYYINRVETYVYKNQLLMKYASKKYLYSINGTTIVDDLNREFEYNSFSKHLEKTRVFTKYMVVPYDYTVGIQTTYVHDTNGNYTHQFKQSWDTTKQKWVPVNNDTTVVYYYELIKPTPESVTTNKNNNTIVTLSPNPSSSFITVNISWKKEEDFVIAIYNTQGQLVRQFGEQATKEYKQHIPLSDLPAGNYMLEVRSKKSRTVKQFGIL